MEPTVTAVLARIDIGIIAVYLLGIVGLGLWVSRQQRTATDFFLASRDSTWPVIGLALLASNISSTTLIGLAGAAYSMGIAVYNYEWMASVVLPSSACSSCPSCCAPRYSPCRSIWSVVTTEGRECIFRR